MPSNAIMERDLENPTPTIDLEPKRLYLSDEDGYKRFFIYLQVNVAHSVSPQSQALLPSTLIFPA